MNALQVALRLMVDEDIEHIPVVDGDRLIGICTRTDLLKVRRHQYALERRDEGWRGFSGRRRATP